MPSFNDPSYMLFLQQMFYEIGDVDEEDEEEDQDFYQDEEDEEEEEDDDDDDDDGEEDDNAQLVRRPWLTSSRVLSDGDGGPSLSSLEATVNGQSSEAVADENNGSCEGTSQGGESSSPCNDQVGSQEGELNRGNIDGLFCPICMEAWTNIGDHKICCLPCGHIFGFSCISRWLQQHRSSGKCPQCNKKCKLKDVRVLYASKLVVLDQELQKKVRSLEGKCASLEKKGADWCKKEVEWRKREVDLHQQVFELKERTSYLEGLLEDAKSRSSGLCTSSEGFQGQVTIGNDQEFDMQRCSSLFSLQKEFRVDGARFFDVDAASQILIIARRLSAMGGAHVLTKMSLIAPHERENIQLPGGVKAVKDLRVSPRGRLALLASLGKKLSVLSLESNNTVLNYDLQAAAWSCSWNLNNSHYIYAGLQNGMLLEFDTRQTRGPVESLTGLTHNPIHTVCPLSPNLEPHAGVRTLITASSVGLCEWNLGGTGERSFLVPQSENQGVCISLAYSPGNDDIVASFRPKVDLSSDVAVSQPLLSPSCCLMGQAVQGSHILYKRMGNQLYQKLGHSSVYVNDIRLPKSAIIDRNNSTPLFASGDEMTCKLVLQELPSLMVVEHLKFQKHPIRDLKYTQLSNYGLLGSLTEDCLKLFSETLL